MYISSVTIDSAITTTNHTGYLTLANMNSEQALQLATFYKHGCSVKIESCSYCDRNCSECTYTRNSATLSSYCKKDVEVTTDLLKHRNAISGLRVLKVIYNKPATIVFWNDDTKTVVKCGKGDKYDPEKGFFIACTKKLFGNDYRAVGRMNKALELAVDVNKKEK